MSPLRLRPLCLSLLLLAAVLVLLPSCSRGEGDEAAAAGGGGGGEVAGSGFVCVDLDEEGGGRCDGQREEAEEGVGGGEEEEEELEEEISSSLDELIRLQQLKLDHLMKSRKKKGGWVPTAKEVEEEKAIDDPAASPPKWSESSSSSSSASSLPPRHGHRGLSIEGPDLESYLLPRFHIEMNYSIAFHHILRVGVVTASDSKERPDFLMLLVLDTAGILHVLNEYGDELLRKNMYVFHKKAIVTTDVEAHSELGPIFVSGSKDGVISVLSLIVEGSGDGVALTAAEVGRFSIRLVHKKKVGDQREDDEASQAPDGALPYPTSLHLYNRGSERGMGIYVGDSYCRFSIFMLNGTVVGRVGVTAHAVNLDRERTGLLSVRDTYECGPSEERGIGQMSRIGQIMALPIGKSVALLHIARLHVPPRLCSGSGEVISEAAFDMTSMTYLLATTSSGTILTFNTKTKDDRGKDTRCSLMKVDPGTGVSRTQDAGDVNVFPKKLMSLKGYVLNVHSSPRLPNGDNAPQGCAGAEVCTMSILNTSSIKKQREGSWLSSKDISADCAAGDVSISVSPKNLRNTRHLLSEVVVAVAHSMSTCEAGRVVEGGSGTRGAVQVYTSVLRPVEVEDELAWLKWPMTFGGVLVFVFYKLFGTKRERKPNTSAGTYSKYGKYSKRFGGTTSSAGGEGGSSGDLVKLRDKISEIEKSVSALDSSGDDLLKKLSTVRGRK